MATTKSICLYFQVHQPDRLRQYRFFDIGNDSNYCDEFTNKVIMRRVAQKCYLPVNALLLDLIRKNGKKFKLAFSISGVAIDQFKRFAPEVIDSFKALADTGCVDFLAETYAHSLASVANEAEFKQQVKDHSKLIEATFGVKPVTFRNTELIYSDAIGATVASMGYTTMLTEGAKHILGWKSPNFVYTNAINPRLRLLLKNSAMSDDIAFRFSDKNWNGWPLTAEKYASWVEAALQNDDTLNLFMDYETFGEHQQAESGIFDFLKALPAALLAKGFSFNTPAEVAKMHQPVAPLHVPDPISWADEERDLSAWLGNELQNEAFHKVYAIGAKVKRTKDEDLTKTYRMLQESDHFYYMCTKFFSDGAVHSYFNPYDTPYEAFINYMNVLSDFELRVDAFLKNKNNKTNA
ncbi:MAG: glycoside hydrolase family 57 protein [Bacteroidales bacterium]|nr:glycoside hydrolase family 57 protein [Bacteroidales bacterium]MBO7585155.1 glycoside hydrolase family 57 protein [Bacteroidales bacterium]